MSIEGALAIVAMTTVALGCKVAGFWAMRYVALTPRLRSALAAVPMASLGAILAPAAASGGIPEVAALMTAAAAMLLIGNDVAAMAIAMAVLLLARHAGF
jgi:uncharacterized membrane protein